MVVILPIAGVFIALLAVIIALNIVKKNNKKTDSVQKSSKESAINKSLNVFTKILQYYVLTLIALFLIFPFLLMLSRSFMTTVDIDNVRLFPSKETFKKGLIFNNYVSIFKNSNYGRYTLNTFTVVIINIFAVPLSASLCAYSFSRLKWKGRNWVFACVLSTIMIPGTVLQVPLYSLFFRFGWIGSLKPLIIPAFFGGGAINIFLMKQFMMSIPKEIDEAAIVDGAGVFRRYLLITPLCSSIILYVMVGTFSSGWSDFMGPLVYVNKRAAYTLAVAIYQDSIVGDVLNGANLRMAAGIFMMLVPAVVFVLYQRKLIDGIMIGAVKG